MRPLEQRRAPFGSRVLYQRRLANDVASEQIHGRKSAPELWAMGKPFYQRDVLGFAPGAEIERPRHEALWGPRRRVRSHPRSRNVRLARRWGVRCPACGGETPDGRLFCEDCGAPLAGTCSTCGAQLDAGRRFCGFCGTPVATSTPLSAAPDAAQVQASSAVAERRLCSVLFVDLVGFTPFAEKRDPEETRELLSFYFERAQAIVANYGGTVEKFIGDAVMAVWGAPVANEDDAERSVRAALDIVASVADLGAESGVELLARAGVVTGEVAITIGKVSEGMVIGDTVNAASRVQSVAPPGAVLVDEATWRAASGAIAFSEFGALNLKGKEEVSPCLACGKGRGTKKRRRSLRSAWSPPLSDVTRSCASQRNCFTPPPASTRPASSR